MKYSILLVVFLFSMSGVRAEEAPAGASEAREAFEKRLVEEVESEAVFEQMSLLAEVLLKVRRHYVDERTYEDLLHGAIRGMLQSLDPHSSFLEADEYEQLLDDTSGSYGGIGITIGMRDGELTVIAPLEDTPAFRAGLQSGDRILAIDGNSTVDITLREAVNQLRGEPGDPVTLTVASEGEVAEKMVEIVRADIEVVSVKGTQLIADGVGYVRIVQFDEPTSDKLADAVAELSEEGMEALVLDLRGNPGGLLRQAVRVSAMFLPEGARLVSTKGRSELSREVIYRGEGGVYTNLPLVVLVNGGSASASEIVAGAMQDHGRAVVIGQQTFGKGSVQSVIQSGEDDETAIRLTTAYYYTPDERLIHEVGIMPDIEVPIGRDEWRDVQIRRAHMESPDVYGAEEVAEYEQVVDRQLQRAVDLLRALMVYQSAAKP